MKKFVSIDPINDVKEHCSHVRILFADGEVCSTKGGACWNKRSLHSFSPALAASLTDVPPRLVNLFDKEYGDFPCTFIIGTYEEGEAICNEYRALLGKALDES